MLKLEGVRYIGPKNKLAKGYNPSSHIRVLLYIKSNGRGTYLDIYPLIKKYGHMRLSEAYVHAICTPLLDEEFASDKDLTDCIIMRIHEVDKTP